MKRNRTRLRQRGARAERDAGAVEQFSRETILSADGHCECCGDTYGVAAHHMASRARAVGHAWLHDSSRNGACLCQSCHRAAHDGDLGSWIKTRQWLDAGGRVTDE